ncbi:MAG: NADP-dependent isocitrate dehydrogenase [Sedimentibacter sp.]|uniref:NADP-dependent isocitrate dehydrogenase n=1 Tax=Sedimentibacter sp. TaxID=1960295 RepID=UPI003159546D
MEKIKMTAPLVELDGDEMARVIWHLVKEKLLLPHIDLKTEYYDLHLKKRDETDDSITTNAAYAIKKHGVGVKCATITANEDRKIEYSLKTVSASPNGTIRKILDGTVFRKPITFCTITPLIPRWKKPITIARHSYGDVYTSTSMDVEAGTRAEIVLTSKDGREKRTTIFNFEEDGIVMGEYNLDSSIRGFARSCFMHALEEKCNLMFATKDTVVKAYDNKFKEVFEEYWDKYKKQFENAGIDYTYTLIDDAVSRIIKSEGGIIWACKNYDGDVMSDMVATGYGSLALMTSVLVSPDGSHEYEASHGTVKQHYYRHLKGESTSTNPIAIIFAWTGALRKRGELDANQDLVKFCDSLEQACRDTIDSGAVTKDLFELSSSENKKIVTTEEIIDLIAKNIKLKFQ